jgi:hypothetical protein
MLNVFNDLDPTDFGVRIIGLRSRLLSEIMEFDQVNTEKSRIPFPKVIFTVTVTFQTTEFVRLVNQDSVFRH